MKCHSFDHFPLVNFDMILELMENAKNLAKKRAVEEYIFDKYKLKNFPWLFKKLLVNRSVLF